MRSATDFLPCRMMEFMNLDTTKSLNLGSGLTSRFSALCRRDIGVFLDQSVPVPGSFLRRESPAFAGILMQRGPYLGLFAPYLERLCFLSATPCVSSTPRMMW